MINDLTVKQLIKICQKYKIKNYSGLRKKQLIRHVQKFLNKKQKKQHKMNEEMLLIC